MKPPSRKVEAPSPEKLEPSPSPKPAAEEKRRDSKEATSEQSAEDGIPSFPFDPQMLPHLDMSTEEIGCKDVLDEYFSYMLNYL